MNDACRRPDTAKHRISENRPRSPDGQRGLKRCFGAVPVGVEARENAGSPGSVFHSRTAAPLFPGNDDTQSMGEGQL